MRASVTGKLVGNVEYKDGKPFATFQISVGYEENPTFVKNKVWEVSISDKLKGDVNYFTENYLTFSGTLKLDSFGDIERLEISVNRFITVAESGETRFYVKIDGDVEEVSEDGTAGVISAQNGMKDGELLFCDVDFVASGAVAERLKGTKGRCVVIEGDMSVEVDDFGDVGHLIVGVKKLIKIAAPVPRKTLPATKQKASGGSAVDLNDDIPFEPQWK